MIYKGRKGGTSFEKGRMRVPDGRGARNERVTKKLKYEQKELADYSDERMYAWAKFILVVRYSLNIILGS